MPAPYVSPYQRAQRARAFIEAMSPVEFDMYVTGMSREATEAAHRARATLSAMSQEAFDELVASLPKHLVGTARRARRS